MSKATAKELLAAPKFEVTLDDKSEPGKHFYCIAGYPGYEKLPGVTTPLGIVDKSTPLMIWARNVALDLVLKRADEQHTRGKISIPALQTIVNEARRRPDKERDDAADLGTLVHSLIDKIVLGQRLDPSSVPMVALPAVSAFYDWFDSQDLEFIMGDTKVASLVHRYGGSLDALARRRNTGKIVLLDWKTSKKAYDTHALQAAGGYHLALEETYGIVADEAVVVRFSKTEPITFGVYEVADIARSKRAWLLALGLWREMKTPHFVKHNKTKGAPK